MNIVKATRKMLAYHSMRESSYREVPESEMILSIEDEDTLNVILENENSHPLRKFLKQNRLKLITILFSLTLALIYRLFVHQDGKNPALSSILIIPALLILGLYAATLFEHAVLKVLQLLSNPDSSMGAVDALSSRLRFLILFGFVNYYAIPFWLEEPHFGDDFLRLFFRASFVIALSWILKELGYAIIRKFAFVSTLKSDLYNLRAIKDSIWFVCCPNTASRHRLMKMWREQAAQRASFDRKVAELRSCKMDLPLVDINGGAEWDFSLKESFHVASTTKMRAIAQFMAKRLFEGGSEMNLAKWSQMFPSATSASRAWTLLFKDISQSQPIHAEEFVWALIQAFERLVHLSNRALNLDNLLNVVLIGINSIFYLMIGSYVLFAAGVDLSAMVVTFATAFASLTFAFSGMITRIFESMIWVFITKAVEVGDLVQLNNEDFTILRIRLMSSDLRAGDGRVMTIPNGILAQNPIYNMRLTSSAVVSIRFQVSYSCSRDKLTLLKKGIESYVQKNSEIWRYPMDLRVTDLIDSSSWTVIAILHHRLNWQQKNIIAEDRFEIANEIRNLINDLGIGYRDPDKYVDASAPSQSMTTNALPTNNISSFQK